MNNTTLFVEETPKEKVIDDSKKTAPFLDIFNYLLNKGVHVEFVPYIVNHMLSSEHALLKYCSMFDYFLPKLNIENMQDFMYMMLPKSNHKYFTYVKNTWKEIPGELKAEAVSKNVSYKNVYQYYAMLFNPHFSRNPQ